MTTQQAALVIRDAIREAAREYGCKPSQAHIPHHMDRCALAARAVAVRHAYDQGIDKDALADAFARSRDSINKILILTKP